VETKVESLEVPWGQSGVFWWYYSGVSLVYTVGILLGPFFGVIWVDTVEVAVEEHILEKFGSVGDFILVGLFW
jgi:hypothetical protein